MRKRQLMLIFYASSGLMLFLLTLLTIHTQLLQIKVETAVVNVPLLPLSAKISGFISEILVTTNSEVKKGTLLANIENPELEKEIALTKLNAEDALLAINFAKQLLKNEQERLYFYKNVSESRLTALEAGVNTAELNYHSAQKNLSRMEALYKKHYLSTAEWDSIKEKFHTASNRLKATTAQRELEHHALNAVEKGLYFTGNKIEGREKDLLAEIEIAQKRLQLQQEKVKIFQDLQKKLRLIAPCDAKIIQILHYSGNTVDNNKPIFILAPAHAQKTVIAYLTQEQITHIQLGTPVKVYLPAVDQTYLGKVIEVNRTAGFVDEIRATYRSRDLYADKTAMVTIEIQDKHTNDFYQNVSAGIPAIVYFSRHWFNFL